MTVILRSESPSFIPCLLRPHLNLVNPYHSRLPEELGVFYGLNSSPEPKSPSLNPPSLSSSLHQSENHSSRAFSEAFPSFRNQASEAYHSTPSNLWSVCWMFYEPCSDNKSRPMGVLSGLANRMSTKSPSSHNRAIS